MTGAGPYDYWWKHHIALFDTETTGLPHEGNARVVEVGVARFEEMKCVDRWGSLINPGIPIPKEVSDIHGISDADVANAPTFLEALPHLLNVMHGAWPAAYNANFDRTMWSIEIDRLPIDPIPHAMFDVHMRWLDPLTWVRKIDGIWAGNKLTEACARRKLSIVNAHRAEDDAEASGRLLYALGKDMPRVTMTELLRRQQYLWERQDEERRRWYQKKGIPYH
jgi:ATP-dependent DNA helicase DinG